MKFIQALGGRPSAEQIRRAEASGHYEKGVFKNSVPTIKLVPGAWKRLLLEYFRGKKERVPKHPLPVLSRSRSDFDDPPENGIRVTWLGHASTLIEIGGRKFLTDPVWSERVSPFESFGPKRFFRPPLPFSELPSIDAVLISHDHYDHLDMDSVKGLASTGVTFYVPLNVGAHLERWGIAKTQIVEMNWEESAAIGEVALTFTPARHFSGRRLTDENRTFWGSFVLRAKNGRNIFYSGDTGPLESFKEVGRSYGPFDATILQIGACSPLWPEVHMTPEEAVTAHLQLRGGLLLPVHWGTFNLATHAWHEPAEWLMTAAEKANVEVAIPQPGEQIVVGRPRSPRPEKWWRS